MTKLDVASHAPRPKPPTKAEQSLRTRGLIINTGIRCLATYGYANTSMHLIAQEAGVSRGPVHYHFADKNDLMGAIAEALPQQVPVEVKQRLARGKTVADRIEALIEIGLEEHLGDHHFVAIELLIAARRDPALAASVLPHLAAGEAAIDRWFVEFAGDLAWDDERLMTFRAMLVATLRGLAVDHLQRSGDGTHERVVAMLKDMLLAYILGPRRAEAP